MKRTLGLPSICPRTRLGWTSSAFAPSRPLLLLIICLNKGVWITALLSFTDLPSQTRLISPKAGDFWRDEVVWCQRFTRPCLKIFKSSFYDFFLRPRKKCPICWLALSEAAGLSAAYGPKKQCCQQTKTILLKLFTLWNRPIGKLTC